MGGGGAKVLEGWGCNPTDRTLLSDRSVVMTIILLQMISIYHHLCAHQGKCHCEPLLYTCSVGVCIGN